MMLANGAKPVTLTELETRIWLGTFAMVLVWSGWRPYEFTTWVLEVAPALIAFVVLALTRERFPLTRLVY